MKRIWMMPATPKTEMLEDRRELIRSEVAAGTGADIGLETTRGGLQSGLRIWFEDLGRPRSPIVELTPTGLNRFCARLTFGTFAAPTIDQMLKADPEEIQLARALVASVSRSADMTFPEGQTAETWMVGGAGFALTAERKGLENRFGEEAIASVCRELVIPMMAAMAELYGYDPVDDAASGADAGLEGAVHLSVIRRRERNPRNRLLCLRLHGERCCACGLDPRVRYGEAGDIIEVHHLQPLSLIGEPRVYDPATDLVPLCPNCHRAVHTRRPVPWLPGDLKKPGAGHA